LEYLILLFQVFTLIRLYYVYNWLIQIISVEPGHQGIVYSRISGINKDRRLTEGLNLLIPWFERAVVYDIRARPQQINSHSGSKGEKIHSDHILS
jgi:regulator of protease activity HflC (stomatin/prohibitin superfamily)